MQRILYMNKGTLTEPLTLSLKCLFLAFEECMRTDCNNLHLK